MLRRLVSVVTLATSLSLSPAMADAQSGLRDRIEQELFTFGTCGVPLCLDVSNIHGDHFLPSLAEGNDAVIAFLTDAIGRAASSVPLGATSSGATFTFVGGLPVATSTSAGPIFNERAQTLGRGRFFMGASVTGIEFTSLNGAPLSNLQLNFQHQDGDPTDDLGDPVFENDVMALELAMDVSVLVATVAMTYGVTDFLDIGVAVPIVRTSVRGRSDAQILPFGGPSAIHHFAGDASTPVLRAAASMEGSASGIGDVAARLKINLGQSSTMGAALLTEIRFPTGDEEDLLGAGAMQIRVLGLYSAQLGTFSPHLNVGYTARAAETANDAVFLAVAFDNLMTDWATLAVGVESEFQVGENKFDLPGPILFSTPFTRRVPATNVPNKSGDLLRATVGVKFTVRGGTVLVANALFPLRDVGLQPDFIWTLGLDFPF